MDVVFDTVGGETFQRAFSTLRKGGFMVTVVAFPDGEAERHGVRVTRSFTRPSAGNLTLIRDLVEAGRVAPRVAAVVPFAEIRQALTLSEAGHAQGKIVLAMEASRLIEPRPASATGPGVRAGDVRPRGSSV